MEIWVPITVTAALVQTLRFALQKRLKLAGFSNASTTLARFLYSAPLVVIALLIYAKVSGQTLPQTTSVFWLWSIIGGTTQILATLCTVALFGLRNFAVGMTFKKTEVLLAAIIGLLILGDSVGFWGWVSFAIGLVAVLSISEPPNLGGQRFFNKATGLGLLSGLGFAMSAVTYRAAALELPSGTTALRAGMTLATTTSFQTLVMITWMAARNRADLRQTFTGWRLALPVGLTSMMGSFCLFSAFALASAAYVNAVGQIELIFSLTMGWLMFQERAKPRELIGIALLFVSILLLILTS
ncbi:MAG: EamA family transporter [Deltaproteobacteria bacterium]